MFGEKQGGELVRKGGSRGRYDQYILYKHMELSKTKKYVEEINNQRIQRNLVYQTLG